MRAREILFEMPYLMAGSLDWGLDDPTRNRRRAGVILNSHPAVLRSDQFGALYRRVTPHGGEFAHIAADTGLITYYMHYETAARAGLGNCATQVKVWATIAPGMIGIAGDVFFNVMLVEFDTMISDHIQTVDGRRFWLRRMAEAIQKGMQVGLLDHGSPTRYNRQISFQPWVVAVDGWGQRSEHHERLFYISKLPPGNLDADAPQTMAEGEVVPFSQPTIKQDSSRAVARHFKQKLSREFAGIGEVQAAPAFYYERGEADQQARFAIPKEQWGAIKAALCRMLGPGEPVTGWSSPLMHGWWYGRQSVVLSDADVSVFWTPEE